MGHAIRVTVAADLRHVRIRVRDKGGGLSDEVANVWSYSVARLGAGRLGWNADLPTQTSWEDPFVGLGIKKDLMGLPLVKLYTQYLGGSLDLMTVPGVGVDAWLSFQRLDVGSGNTSTVVPVPFN